MIELVVFLGNPGREYSHNRHNAGFLLAEKLPFFKDLSWQKKFKSYYAVMDRNRLTEYLPAASAAGTTAAAASTDAAGTGTDAASAAGTGAVAVLAAASVAAAPGSAIEGRLHFIKPETFMNKSGESAAAAASFFKIKPASILVIHDELELPLGTVSLKFGGGLGGHNGLRSMKASFGSADFWRIRIGIGRPDSRLPGEGGPPGSGEGIVDWVLSDFDIAEKDSLDRVLKTGAELLFLTFVNDPERLLKEWAKKKIPEPLSESG